MSLENNGIVEQMIAMAELGGSQSKDSVAIMQRLFDMLTDDQRRRLVSAVRVSASGQLAFLKWVSEEYPDLSEPVQEVQ
jgi:hypothetical protein